MKNLEAVRKEILSRAQMLFARYGFDKTTLSEITSGKGRCKSSIYYHFKNKEDIFKGVVAMEFETMRKELEAIIEDGNYDPSTRFAAYISRRVELLDGATAYGYTVTTFSPLSKLLVTAARESFDKWEREFFDEVWSDTVSIGLIPQTITREAFSNTLSGLMKSLENQYYNASDKNSVKELCRTMTELLIHHNPILKK